MVSKRIGRPSHAWPPVGDCWDGPMISRPTALLMTRGSLPIARRKRLAGNGPTVGDPRQSLSAGFAVSAIFATFDNWEDYTDHMDMLHPTTH